MSTILLVDGDPLQALTRKAMLETRFTNVRRVSDAAEALCLLEQPQFAQKLGMVISSHHGPGITAPAFVAELHARIPALPVLVLGGDNDNAANYTGTQTHFLSRPFAKEAMLTATSEMLKQK
jgi:DNA-binding NtrC family response regulator